MQIEELIETIREDSTLMLIVGVGASLFLVVFLVLLVSAMRIKFYKNKYRRIDAENISISEIRTRLEQELKAYKITDKKNKNELAFFQSRIDALEIESREYASLKKSTYETEKILHQTQEKLDVSYAKNEALKEELTLLQEKHDKIMGENTKNRANNARLLRKLEQDKG